MLYSRPMRVNTEKIDAERERIGESKSKFAKRLGMKLPAYLQMMACASTTIRRIAKIGDALHMDPRDLLSR
jgi:hypothetical protein